MQFALTRYAAGECSCLQRIVSRGAACLLVALSVVSCSKLPWGGASLPTDVAAAYESAPDYVRRMTHQQYANTIAYVFGRDVEVGSPFAPLRRTEGLLASGAASAGVTSGELQQLQRSAAAIAAQVMDPGNIEQQTPSRREYLVPCKPANPAAADDDCALQFIQHTGRLLFRRPLQEAKVAALVEQAHRGATDMKDFYAGLTSVLEGLLIDPHFLLIVDTTEPDPQHPDKRRLDAYSLASRLSFFLWDAGPDEALLNAAESGALYNRKELERTVDMMLASPRLENGVRAFFDDMFGFEDFGNLAKDASVYPKVTGATLQDAREQTLRTVVDLLITRKGDYRELFTTRDTFISPALATVYQVPTLPGWVPYEFPQDSQRFGILTQVSFLGLHAHPARSSPTHRGKALRELLLCQKVPPPPGNVDFSALENPDAKLHTARERLTAHRKNPSCAGCHKITDPIGLALESFDGSGAYRDNESGAPIDTSGDLDGRQFQDAQGLAQALHDNPAVTSCLVTRLYSYGSGGPAASSERPILTYLKDRFAAAGYRVPDLMRAIALGFALPRTGDAKAQALTAQQSAERGQPLSASNLDSNPTNDVSGQE